MSERCDRCDRRLAALRTAPPTTPPDFWETEQLREAFEAQHIGQVSRAYRQHPHHIAAYGRNGITQEIVGEWLGLTQAQVSRIETGPPVRHLDTLEHWVRTLGIPEHLLWFKMSAQRSGKVTCSPGHRAEQPSIDLSPGARVAAAPQPATAAAASSGSHGTVPAPFPIAPFADADHLKAVRQHIRHTLELSSRFGGTDLAGFAVRFFQSVHRQLATGTYDPAIERDLQAVAGELAEVAGWLLFDAGRQDDTRRMNQEALYFSRLAGDRQMELLTLQNIGMHAGFLGRPHEALHLAESVLQSRDRLTPRLEALFLVRKARALAQAGDGQAVQLFAAGWSRYQDGVRDSDPAWAWWIDDRELAWHEGMIQLHLGRPTAAVQHFERAVAGNTSSRWRAQYCGLAYLLGAQTLVDSWRDAEATLRQLMPFAGVVASQQTVVLLRKALPRLREPHVPVSTHEAAEQLQLALA